MKRNVIFKIDNKIVDYLDSDAFPLVLNKELIDYKSLEKRKGEFSFTIQIPKTKNNNKIFNNIYLLEKQNKFNKINDYEVIIEVNSEEIIKGIFKLQSIEKDSYNGIVIAKSIAWYTLLQGKTLRDLQLTEIEFNNLKNDIVQTWDKTDLTSDILYPVITYGNWFASNSGFQFDNLTSPDTFYYRLTPPALYLTVILRKIFDIADIQLGGNFMEDSDIRKLYIPKVGADESFWNWNVLARPSVQKSYSITFNADSSIGGQNVDTRKDDCKVYQSCIFDYYLKATIYPSGVNIPNLPGNNTVGDLYLIWKDNTVQGQMSSGVFNGWDYGDIVRYIGGDVTQQSSWQRIELTGGNANSDWKLYFYSGNSGPYTLNTSNGNADLTLLTASNIGDFTRNTIVGYVAGGLKKLTDLTVTSDKGLCVHPSNDYLQVPIDGYYDFNISAQGTSGFTTTDVGIEGYALYPIANDINNLNVIATVKNLGSEITESETIQAIFDYYNGGSLNGNVINVKSYRANDNVINLTNNDGDNELVEGDKLTYVHVTFAVGYFRVFVGYRNIGNTSSLTTYASMLPAQSNLNEQIKNYETNEYVPAYDTIQPARCLPDMPLQDFVRGVMNLFNLYFNYNPITNVIEITSYDTFYKERLLARDITSLVDDDTLLIEPITTARLFELSYTKDDNDTIVPTLSHTITNDNIFNQGENKIQVPFSPTWNGRLNLYNTDKSINCPVMFNAGLDSIAQSSYEQERNFNFNMRILSFKEKKLDANGYEITWRFDDGIFQTDTPESEFPAFLQPKALVDTYYGGIFDLVGGKERLTLNIYLTEKDYRTLRLDIPVIYKDNYYIIESINNYSVINEKSPAKIKLNKY